MNDIDLLKEKYKLSDNEYSDIERNIIKFYTEFVDSVKNPLAVILGGQPGAGKSELEKVAMNNLDRNAVVCNVDNLKDWHPKASEVKNLYPEKFSEIIGPAAHLWNLSLRNHCVDHKLNFILETTFSDADSINIIIERLKRNKFNVDIYLLAVPKEISKIGIYERYEVGTANGQEQRMVLAANHDERFDKIPETLLGVENMQLYDFIHLFGRRMTNLNLDDRFGIYQISKTSRSVYADFMSERNQKLIQKVTDLVAQKVERVEQLMEERNAPEEEVSKFRNEFPQYLSDKTQNKGNRL